MLFPRSIQSPPRLMLGLVVAVACAFTINPNVLSAGTAGASSSATTTTTSLPITNGLIAPTGGLNDNVRDTSLWGVGFLESFPADPNVTVSETNGRVQITPRANYAGTAYNGYLSVNTYDLTDAAVTVNVVQQAGPGTHADTQLEVGPDAGHLAIIYVEGTSIRFGWFDSAWHYLAMLPYSPSTHAWWRIRTASGTLFWDTAPDGLSWTTQASTAAPFATTAVRVNLDAGTWDAVASPGVAIFDNLNVAPAPDSTRTAADTGSPTATTVSGTLAWSVDFETGDLSQWPSPAHIHQGMPTFGNSKITVVSAPARGGRYAARLEVNGPATTSGKAGSQRAELNAGAANSGTGAGEEWYYGFSAYVPSGVVQDWSGTPPNQVSGWSYTNLWQQIDTRFTTSPVLSVGVWRRSGSLTPYFFFLRHLVDDNTGQQIESDESWDLGDLTYDQWIDFTVHARWSRDGSTGLVQVWGNGVEKVPLSSRRTLGSLNPDGSEPVLQMELQLYRNNRDGTNLWYIDSLKRASTYALAQP